MNLRYLYIIMCIFSLLALPGCRDEEAVQTSEGTRTVTVNLGIAMSRADKDKDIGDSSTPKDMKVWIFNQDNTELVDYYEIKNPTFSGSDILNELVNTHEHVFELDNAVTMLNFYAVLNSESGTGLEDLGESSPVIDIQNATFTGLQDVAGDNQVPVYGTATVNVRDHKNSYPVTIETERAVSKLELFFTKESEKSNLAITGITLTNIPNKGFLAREATTDDELTYSRTETLFTGSLTINKHLTEETALGDFSTQAESFNTITLSQPYLLENPYNTAWSDNSKTDYEFPQPEEADEKAYVLTVAYTLNNKEEKRSFVLPETKRNIWNKIFVRVNDNGELIIQYKALPWQLVKSSIGYAPQHVSTSSNPFTDETSYNEFINGDNYVLFPLENYEDYHTTQGLFNHLYDNPQKGDNEARLCIITRPTYDESTYKDDKDKHMSLKTGSAGARYYFMLTGPEGATWEAHLNDPDGNFAFSNSVNDDDFADCTDEGFSKEVRMATHGIAREQPYIIQIVATHLYTSDGEHYTSGISDLDTEPRFDNIYADLGLGTDEDKWESYFGYTYLTTWGKDKWDNKKTVEAEFYITVKLTDGTEYELTINPSFKECNIENKYFPFKEKRRFAGTDTRIWFRHLRAQYGWRNLECLARDLKEDIKEEDEEEAQPWNKADWWTVNPYWNSEHVESVWKQ